MFTVSSVAGLGIVAGSSLDGSKLSGFLKGGGFLH